MTRTYTEESAKLAVAYIREDRWGESRESQGNRLTQYAAKQGYQVLKWYEDEASTGYDRYEWDDAVMDVMRGPVYRLLYTSVDRLGDTARSLLELREAAEASGWRLEGLDGTDSGTPLGRAAFAIAAAQAEQAVDLRKEGRHSLQFTTAEMREIYLLLQEAGSVGDSEWADRYAKRFNLRD